MTTLKTKFSSIVPEIKIDVENGKAIFKFGEKVLFLQLDAVSASLHQTDENFLRFFKKAGAPDFDVPDTKKKLQTKYLIAVGITPDYSKIKLKTDKQLIRSIDLFYQDVRYVNGKYVGYFNVYSISIGKGKPKIYLITPYATRILSGTQFLAITPLVESPEIEIDNDCLVKIAREYKFEGKEITWTKLFDFHTIRMKNKGPIFFGLQKPLTEEEIEEIKKWDFEKLEHDYFYEGLQKNDEMVYCYKPQVISFETNPYRNDNACRRVQPYNSNATIVTPTKWGKTTLGHKIGKKPPFTDASSAGMSGFSTAKETTIGTLDGGYRPAFYDNAQNYSLGALKGILEIKETGMTNVGKGKEPVIARTTGAQIMHANPKNVDDPLLLRDSFIKIAELYTTASPGASGSRDAIIFFRTGTEEKAIGVPLSRKIVEKNELVFDHIVSVVNKEIESKIFVNDAVQRWLNSFGDVFKDYVRRINSLLKDATLPSAVKEYWRDHAESAFRHIRGTALKQAIVDKNLKSIYLGDYNIKKILDGAEKHVKRIQAMNILSLQKLLKFMDKEAIEEWIYAKYEAITIEKVKAIILAVTSHFKKSNYLKIFSSHLVTAGSLSESYNTLPEEKKIKGYSYFSKVTDYIIKAQMRDSLLEKYNRILHGFGLHLSIVGNNNDTLAVTINRDYEIKVLGKKFL